MEVQGSMCVAAVQGRSREARRADAMATGLCRGSNLGVPCVESPPREFTGIYWFTRASYFKVVFSGFFLEGRV